MRQVKQGEKSSKDSPMPQSVVVSKGFLVECLVDADANASSRAEKAKGRAIGISAFAQACVLALILIVPLFATSRPITVINAVPIAPYGGIPRQGQEVKIQENVDSVPARHQITSNGPQFHPPKNTSKRDEAADDASGGDLHATPNFGSHTGDSTGNSSTNGFIPGFRTTIGSQPNPPAPALVEPKTPVAVSEGAELAQLLRRVEPVYPTFAIHSHLEGSVELRAIIGRDGSVRELRVLSGNPILAYAAQEAVKQWRFRPTMLNGQPVEVDTFFTVVFKIKQ